jgi:uncharacterized protein
MAFRILSLDGGGAWSLIQVRALIELYGPAARGRQVLRNFDLVAACSGGSLVLAGLVEDMPLSDILLYFRDEQKRRSLFSPTQNYVDAAVRRAFGIGPKYSTASKLPALQALLPNTGNAPLAGSMAGVIGPAGRPVHLLVVCYNYDSNRAVFFRSAASGRPGVWGAGEAAGAAVTLAAAVHASTTAPLNYFDAPAMLPGWADRFWDGGITGCNNPCVAAVVEALTLGEEARDVAVLGIGTGTVALPPATYGQPASPLEEPRPNPSLTTDLRKLATAVLDDPPDAASFIAHAMTGANAGLAPPLDSRLVRMNPLITPRRDNGVLAPPEGWSNRQFRRLCDIDIDAVDSSDVAYIDSYCSYWLADRAPNQPIRMRRSTLTREIGHAIFSEAKAAWAALFPVI